VSRFFYWCCGVDHILVGARSMERARYVTTAVALLLTGVLAGAGVFLLVMQIVDGVAWWMWLVAVIWAVAIFNVDRSLLVSFDYGRMDRSNLGELPKRSVGHRVMTYGSRIAFAALVAFAVAEPAMLALFAPEVEQQMAVNQQGADRIAEETAKARFADRQKEIDAALGRAEKAAQVAHTRATDARAIADAEENGTGGTRRVGCDRRPGSVCLAKRAAAEEAEAQDRAAQDALVRAREARTKAQARLDEDIEEASRQQREANASNRGFLAREAALDQVIDKHPSLLWRKLTITGLLFMIDLLPILIKLFGPLTWHDRTLRRVTAETSMVEDDDVALRRARRAAIAEEENDEQDLEMRRRRQLSAMRLDAELDEVRLRHEDQQAFRQMRADVDRYQRKVDLDIALEQQRVRAELAFRQIRHHYQHEVALMNRFYATTAAAGPGGPSPEPYRSMGRSHSEDRVLLNNRWVLTSHSPNNVDGGGMGETRIAYDKDNPNHRVVAKWFRQKLARNDADREFYLKRFQVEIDRHRAVDSRHVAEVVDSGSHPEFGLFIITTLYPYTLDSRLAMVGDEVTPFVYTLEWALRIGGQVLQGLSECWRQEGLVHLDIKPGNIALDTGDIVKLIDFGLAKKLLDSRGGQVSSVALGYTAFYAPPEQMRRHTKWIGPRSDVRGAGATLYEMITGHPPLWAEGRARGLVTPRGEIVDLESFIKLVERVKPARAALLVPGVPAVVDDLLAKMLEPKPLNRHADVLEAAAELTAAMNAVVGTDAEYLPVGVRYNRWEEVL
jgi:hypothetical protein